MIAGEFLLDARANGWIFQALKELLDTAIGDPRRKRGSELRGTGRVGIHVGGNVKTGVARELDGGDNILHAAPAWLTADLQMKNLDGEMCFATDADGFGESGHFRCTFTAHVRGVKAAVF